MIKSYQDFLNESILLTSPDFAEILYYIKDPIAEKLYNLIRKDIKTDFNLLDIGNQPSEVFFMNDTQLQRKLSGKNDQDKHLFLLNCWDQLSNTTTIGRIITRLFSENNIPFSQTALNEFIEKYKAEWESRYTTSDIRLVEGEGIKQWYLEDNYTSEKTGTLKNSCMRFWQCQDFFEIYEKNPNQVKLAIKTRMEEGVEKLLTRALIWETDKGRFIDRVYYTKPSDEHLFNDWAKRELGCFAAYSDPNMVRMSVRLENYISREVPYLDTFLYLKISEENLISLYNFNPFLTEGDRLYRCQNTDGTGDNMEDE